MILEFADVTIEMATSCICLPPAAANEVATGRYRAAPPPEERAEKSSTDAR